MKRIKPKGSGVRRMVFLDTQVFDRHCHDLDHQNFKTLAKHVASGSVELVTNSITDSEVRRHLSSRASEAFEALRSISKRQPIVHCSNTTLAGFFDKTKLREMEETLQKELLQNYDDWLRVNSVRVLNLEDTDPMEVFEAYFKARPPFGSGDKKCEFPDAFALQCILHCAMRLDRNITVVSGDLPIGEFCRIFKRFLSHYQRLSEFLETIPDPRIVSFLHKLVSSSASRFRRAISKTFADEELYVMDVVGEVSDIKVADVEILKVFILEGSKGTAVAELECLILFEATVDYQRPGTGRYDKEDDVIYFPEMGSVRSEHSLTRKVVSEFRYSVDPIKLVEITVMRMKETYGGAIDIGSEIF